MVTKSKLHLERIVFYLLILFLPTQFGKHFWPEFSYIQGIRIDYLSPTLYFTDILIFVLLVLFIIESKSDLKKNSKFKIKNSKLQFKIKNYLNSLNLLTIIASKYKLWLIFMLILVASIIISKNPFAGTYGLVKIFEFIFFGFYVSRKIKNIKDLKLVSLIFTIGILFESLLSIAQYFNQRSIGSIFYFLGERAFNSQTPGIANASLNGELVLRPYGTFPHPNVLAGYLIIGMTMIIFNLKFLIFNQFKNISKIKNQKSNLYLKSQSYKIFLGLSILIGTVALLLTMSRIAILLWFIIASFFVLRHFLSMLLIVIPARRFEEASPLGGKAGIKKRGFPIKLGMTRLHNISLLLVALVFIGSILALSPIRYRFTNFSLSEESLIARKDLMNTSFAIIKDNPIFGVGINNFLVNIPYYQKFGSTSLFSYFQPVHNIFLLVATETGMVGFTIFLFFIIKTILKTLRRKFTIYNLQFTVLALVLILGLFDHYFLTLQQGQLLFAFILGLCWSKIKIDEGKNKRDNRI